MITNSLLDFLLKSLRDGRINTGLAMAAVLSITASASADSIGMNFVRGAGSDVFGVQNGTANSLAPADEAGAPGLAQTNWNNLGSRGTNVVVIDSSGASSGVTVNWIAANNWSQSGGGTPNDQFDPNADLMNAYLDSNNGANTNLNPDFFANPTGNMPLVYLSGLEAWLTAQGVSHYDVVVYSDGDGTDGRVGEFWLVDASGPTTAMTLGDDLTTRVFVADRANFVSTFAYAQVPLTVSSGQAALRGNFQGNHLVFTSLTNDSFVLRPAEFNFRSPINAIQIIPRATPQPAAIDPVPSPQIYAGGTARFAAQVAGVLPMTFQWRKGTTDLADGGNISGANTATLTIANVSAADQGDYTLVVTNPNGSVTSSVANLTIVAPVADSYPESIAASDPLAYWRLNDTTDPFTNHAVALDFSGGFNGIFGNGALNGFNFINGPQPPEFPGFETGNFALMPAFNVPRSWVLAPALGLTTNTLTIAAWIHPTASQPTFTGLVFARGTGTNVHGLSYGNNNTLGYNWNNQGAAFNFASGLVVPQNRWSLVALTVTPGNAILYLYNTSGQISATNAVAHAPATFSGLTTIGVDPFSASTPQNRAFAGMIDEVAIFDQALSQAEIFELFKKGLGLEAIAPVISTHPQSKTLFEGRTAQFSVAASGDEPLSFQWRKGGVNLSDGGNISGATSPLLSLSNITSADEGSYDVVVANLVDTVTSDAATLTVLTATGSAFETEMMDANPLAWWRLNETSGDVAVDAWGGINATHTNFVMVGQPGPQPPDFIGMEDTNVAAGYDGISTATSTEVSLVSNRGQFSILGWFNMNFEHISGRVGLFGQNNVAEFGFHDTAFGIWTPNGGFASIPSSSVPANTWCLAAAVGNGTNLNLYLISTNGPQQASVSVTTTNYGASSFPFRIGGGGILDDTGNTFFGTIDEVAFFDRALSAGEVADIFGAAQIGAALPPVISTHPASSAVYAGRNAQFTVSAVGTEPLHHQWRKDGVPINDGGNVSGTATPALSITGVAEGNTGGYDVVITNVAGAVTSSVAALTIVTPTAPYESALITYNPVAYWRLNEHEDPSSGTAAAFDFYGGLDGTYGSAALNGFNGIAGPTPTDGFNVFESTNTALQVFTGTANSFVTAPPMGITTDTLTITAWVNPDSHPSFAGIVFARAGQPATGINLRDNGELGYHWNDTQATWSWPSGLTVPLGQWTFVALVVEPTQATIHVINTGGAQNAVNTVAHAPRAFTDALRIGGDPQNNDRVFSGRIDEVAIFNQALTPAQIQSLFDAQAQVLLSIERDGANLQLTWPQGTLQSAPAVTGPYNNVSGATSPHPVTPTEDEEYFRILVEE